MCLVSAIHEKKQEGRGGGRYMKPIPISLHASSNFSLSPRFLQLILFCNSFRPSQNILPLCHSIHLMLHDCRCTCYQCFDYQFVHHDYLTQRTHCNYFTQYLKSWPHSTAAPANGNIFHQAYFCCSFHQLSTSFKIKYRINIKKKKKKTGTELLE